MPQVEHADPALTVGLAFLAGVICLVIARHARIPGIVLLLAAGVALGPDLAGLIVPESLGEALPILVEFGVAIILFEGGLNLVVRRLRREGVLLRRLVSIGALVTAAGAALAAHWVMRWSWAVSILFGTLVIVTGPTVMAPLLRRIRVKRNLHTILEGEGVLIDPIGAIIALVTLEVMISPSLASVGGGALGLAYRLGLGLCLGVAGGLAVGFLLKSRRLVPEGLENILTLGSVLGLFQIAEALLPESGIMAVTVAGLVVGNMRTRVHRDLAEFKEQLTILLIALLFILLAADVRLAGVLSLGWRGVGTVLCLMLLVRPLNMVACTIGLDLPWRERAFLAWLAPRGIVAAAVASHFAHVMHENHIPGGDALLALVFLVIAMTVVIQGLTGGWVASLLGVRRKGANGVAILGANKLARTVARIFVDAGQEAVVIDSSHDFAAEAEEEGLKVVYGNGLEERTLMRAQLDSRAAAIGLTPNAAANLVFAQHAIEEFKVPDTYVAVRRHSSVTRARVEHEGAHVLFGGEQELERWQVRLERDLADVSSWVWNGFNANSVGDEGVEAGEAEGRKKEGGKVGGGVLEGGAAANAVAGNNEVATAADRKEGLVHQKFAPEVLPVAVLRSDALKPYAQDTVIVEGDVLVAAIHNENRRGYEWLEAHGWAEVAARDTEAELESTAAEDAKAPAASQPARA